MARPNGAVSRLYTVYDNRTDELVILDGTAQECARALGITDNSWRISVTRSRQGTLKKWYITTRNTKEGEI